jgi:cytochrome c peroxidase
LTTTGFNVFLTIAAAAGVVSCGAKRDPQPAPAPVASAPSPLVKAAAPAPAQEDGIDPKLLKRFLPSATVKAWVADPAKIALGRAMFHDKRLSRNGQTACSTCHTLSPAATGQTSKGGDGLRCVRGACEVAEPTTPDQRAVVSTLQRIPGYAELFANAFPGEQRSMTSKNVDAAISAFERGMVNESRWDRYVRGESGALSAAEKQGLKAFLDAGCQSCHSGPELGGTMYQKLGAVIPWPHPGGAKASKAPATDKLVKVPSLKVATLYARHFRESASTKLRDSIKKMGYHQLGLQLSDEDVTAIAVWMQSLMGELDPAYVAALVPPPDMKIAHLP